MSKENLVVKIFKNKLIAQDVVNLKNREVNELIAILLWKKQYSKNLDTHFSLDFLITKISILYKIKNELEDSTINELLDNSEDSNKKIKTMMIKKIKEAGFNFPLLLDDFNGYYN
jgi:hypothetical protein